MSNHLVHETSPYLLQHAANPVDWYPWNAEALERARGEDRPILLSIGYAACHWCHVMAHESFEDEATARLMNAEFVNIKVDREERPDLDGIYMQAVQAMTGHGGWPMTVFLTPGGVPFFAGTYFPKDERHGLPSFARVLRAVSDAYRNRRADVERTTDQVRQLFAAASEPARSAGPLTPALLERAYRALAEQYDAVHGGFGGAPKFPAAMALDYLVRYWARTRTPAALEMALGSFRAMARGGIYDQVGGGFARYAVDDRWLVPHFEKMLYDNALTALLGVHLWQATHDAEIARVVRETLHWALREMRSPQDGFYSSLDADSEGHEGRFYLWTPAEIDLLLPDPDEAALVHAYWGVTPEGNFEGANILSVPHDPAAIAAQYGVTTDHLTSVIARARGALYEARSRRPWPARDDKILSAWNGLMLRALAEAARVLGDEPFRLQAVRTGEFLFRALVHDGRVFRSYKDGAARIAGFLEDHAALGLAALALYEATFDRVWLDRAAMLAGSCVERFWDDAAGAFFDTARDQEALVTRPRDATDNATPSGTSLACDLLARLSELRQDAELRRRATFVLETIAEPMARYPSAFGHALQVTDMLVRGAVELAIVGEPGTTAFDSLARAAADRYVPALVLAGGPPAEGAAVPLLADRPAVDGHATAYVCRDYACQAPVTTPEALEEQLLHGEWEIGNRE
ncbi:MAG TPA: thioredoxin domain-containing protein [Gemmatimonadaceae bacterium]|nr:thioredoxin domain-containing protein [Gemmatimonadaceae bacterium]